MGERGRQDSYACCERSVATGASAGSGDHPRPPKRLPLQGARQVLVHEGALLTMCVLYTGYVPKRPIPAGMG